MPRSNDVDLGTDIEHTEKKYLILSLHIDDWKSLANLEVSLRVLRDQSTEGIASRRLRAHLYAEPQPLTFSRAVDVATIFEQKEKELQELAGYSSCQALSLSQLKARGRPVGTAAAENQNYHSPGPFSRPSHG